ncbi:NADPH-dependent F420 reductase [Promicromonospora iranensis]|uniref:Dinucleotide-binding enzyme n=1 Tax=Promicromonospora iranensis TaxID=1105144 RepID=A0ABU2CKF7_9MICO|nr:NAD(P)-binding domain-containing protein [Promicromonospora iranensis]MDR7381804.1 putative dinucleotide-binding enzyme [Promicromonospora iranensis]
MTTVTVIGAGNFGSVVAGVVAKGGTGVQVLARDVEKARAVAGPLGGAAGAIGAEVTGDVVVLAVPYGAVADVLSAYPGAFDGKVLVDVTNPVDFSTFDDLVVPADSSAARLLQDAVPGAKVVKAFNTNFGGTLASREIGAAPTALPTTVLVAGDDAAAKQTVVELVTAAGLRGVDAGSLKRARELEAVGLLQLTLAGAEKISWGGGLALIS